MKIYIYLRFLSHKFFFAIASYNSEVSTDSYKFGFYGISMKSEIIRLPGKSAPKCHIYPQSGPRTICDCTWPAPRLYLQTVLVVEGFNNLDNGLVIYRQNSPKLYLSTDFFVKIPQYLKVISQIGNGKFSLSRYSRISSMPSMGGGISQINSHV